MKILAVILNYKTPQMTLESAAAAVRALDFAGRDWELVIVDNDSQDGSFEQIQQAVHRHTDACWKKVRVVESGHNGGFGAGNNFAIREALQEEPGPDSIYILNSDAFPAENAIQYLADYLDQHPQTGIVGSYIHGTDDAPHTTAFRFPSIGSELEDAISLGPVTKLFKRYVVPMGIPARTTAVDWLAGASMMMRTAMLREIGLFDETFFLYFEETDLCRRARLKGWHTVYVKESAVAHIGSASTGMKKWHRIPAYWLDSRKHYFHKNHGALYAHTATACRILGGLTWELRKRIQRKHDKHPPGFLWDLTRHWFSHPSNNGHRER